MLQELIGKLLVVSSLLSDGDEKITKFLCATCIKSKSCTLRSAWARLLIDFDELAEHIDVRDSDGTTWHFVLLFAKADEECRANEWRLVHWNAADEVCQECRANRTTRPYTDLGASAAWRPTAVEFMTQPAYTSRAREPLHPLVNSPYFTRWFCFIGLMHVMDCKSVTSSVLGGVLRELTRLDTLGPNREQRMGRINEELATWYSAHPGWHRLPRIKLANLVSTDGWSDLHSPAVKAANTRASVPAFLYLCRKYLTSGSRLHICIVQLMRRLNDFYTILYRAGMFLSDDEMDRLRAATVGFGELYMELREIARLAGELSWPVRPKHHRMQHLVAAAKLINPIHCQCYMEESQIGTTVKVWKRSMSGRYKKGVVRNVLTKRITALMLRLHGV